MFQPRLSLYTRFKTDLSAAVELFAHLTQLANG
jgi:hypothetical protein